MTAGSGVLPSQHMAKFKPVRKKAKGPAAPQGGIPCVIMACLILLLGMLFLYYVMSHANG